MKLCLNCRKKRKTKQGLCKKCRNKCSICKQPNPTIETEQRELICEGCDSKRASKDF